MVALSWHVYQLTGSKLALGIIGACRSLPVLIFGLWGGVTADRLDRRRVLLFTQSFVAFVSAGLFFLTREKMVSPPIIYAAVVVIATVAAFENPARASFVVNVLPREHLENGLALGVLGWQVAAVTGPAVGGLVLANTSLETLYAIDSISFVPLVIVLALIRARTAPPKSAPQDQPKGLRAIAEAFRYLRTRPVLIHIMWLDFFATLFAGSLLLLPVFSNEVFHRGAEGLGWLMAAPAVGAVIAGTIMSSRPPVRRHGAVLLGAIFAYGLFTALFGISHSFWWGLVLLAAGGAADTVSTVVRQIARQSLIPDDMRGRLNSIHMLFFVSGPQLGELEAGALAEVTSVRFSVAAGGLACVLMALGVTAFSSSVRSLRVGQPDAPKAV